MPKMILYTDNTADAMLMTPLNLLEWLPTSMLWGWVALEKITKTSLRVIDGTEFLPQHMTNIAIGVRPFFYETTDNPERD